jgi:hypothetical protein
VKLGFAYLDGGAGGLFLKGAGLGLPVSYVLFLSLMTSLEKMDLQLDYRCMSACDMYIFFVATGV